MGGGGHPVCTIIIFVYVLRIIIYKKSIKNQYCCNELRVIWPIPHEILSEITRSTIIIKTISPVSAGNVIYGLYDPKYALRVIQTHTVGFYGPIRSR